MSPRFLISLLVALTLLARVFDIVPMPEHRHTVSLRTGTMAHIEPKTADMPSLDNAAVIDMALAPAPGIAEFLPTVLLVTSRLITRSLQSPYNSCCHNSGSAPPHLAARQHALWLRFSLLRI